MKMKFVLSLIALVSLGGFACAQCGAGGCGSVGSRSRMMAPGMHQMAPTMMSPQRIDVAQSSPWGGSSSAMQIEVAQIANKDLDFFVNVERMRLGLPQVAVSKSMMEETAKATKELAGQSELSLSELKTSLPYIANVARIDPSHSNAEIVRAWMANPGTAANILSTSYSKCAFRREGNLAVLTMSK